MTKKVDKTKGRRKFTVKGEDYAVRRPKMEEITKANQIYDKAFNAAMGEGCLFRDQLVEELRKRKMWSDDREVRYQALRTEVIEGEFTLDKGGIPLKKARKIAENMHLKRYEMIEMLSSRTELDSMTCQGKADSARFNFLFASCLVYDKEDRPYFPNGLADYLEQQDDEVSQRGANEFYYLIYDTEDTDSKLPENKFLKKYKFANEKGQRIDKDNLLVDTDGRHIDEKGNFIEWISESESRKVDIEGRPLNKDGDFDVEHSPFLDDGGNPIDESVYDEEKPKSKKRKKSAPKQEELAAE